MRCKYYAQNGQPSKLIDELETKYGSQIAKDTWAFVRSPLVAKEYDLALDENGEPTIKAVEDANLINTVGHIFTTGEGSKIFKMKAEKLQKAFSSLGVPVTLKEDRTIEGAAQVEATEEGAQLSYNPDKIRSDSVYHEFGHLLVDLVGYNTPLIQRGVEFIRASDIYRAISTLNPTFSQEQLDKEVLTTAIGMKVEQFSKDPAWQGWLRRFFRKLGEFFGVEPDVIANLADQLVSGNIQERLEGKLSNYIQRQVDIRNISTVFATKKDILDKAIIIVEQKLHDYFSGIEPEKRAINPIYRDFKALSELLKEKRTTDINKGIVEFLTFAYHQTGYLETRISNLLVPDRLSEREIVTGKTIQDITNYNEAFSDILEDIQSAIESDFELRTSNGASGETDPGMKRYIQQIKDRYEKVKRGARVLALEHLASVMLNTGTRNKFVEHLKNTLMRQWNGESSNLKRLASSDKAVKLEAERERQVWADSEIARLKDWNGEGDRSMLETVTRRYYLDLLQTSPGDISWMERMFLAGNMINDEFIQVASEMLDKADFNTRLGVTREYRNAIPLFERFAQIRSESNQKKKYADMIEKDVELLPDGSIRATEGIRQNLVSKYYSKFYDYRAELAKRLSEAKEEHGEESQEYAEELERFNQFLDENTVRPYSDEYYRVLNSLPSEVRSVVKPFQSRKKAILETYAVSDKKKVYNLTDITLEHAEELKAIDKKLKQLASLYLPDGTKKEGKALVIAGALKTYNEQVSDLFGPSEFNEADYLKALARARRQGKEQDFLDKNTSIGISPQFWKDFEEKMGTETTEEGQTIKNIVRPYLTADGGLLYDEMGDEVVDLLRGLYNSRPDRKGGNKQWLHNNVEFVPKPEYKAKLAEMKQLLEAGEISQADYDIWFNRNHTRSLVGVDEDGEQVFSYTPLGFWTTIKPKKSKYFETIYAKHWHSATVKPEYHNTTLSPNESIGGLKDKWLNPQWSALQGRTDAVKEMYDYLTDRVEQDDQALYHGYRLVTTNEAGHKFYKLPAVLRHLDVEIVGDEGVPGFFTNKWRRVKAALVGNKEDSSEFGTDPASVMYEQSNEVLMVQADEQGKERHRAPINLRKPVGVEDQSFDLLSIALLNHHMSQNFENKKSISHDLELMRDALDTRNVAQTASAFGKGTKIKINSVLKGLGVGLVPITKTGATSNSAAAFQSMLEARLYGIKNKGSVRGHQIVTLLSRYTGATVLALNVFSAGANLVSGRLQNYISAAGGQFVDFNDIIFARVQLNKQGASILRDAGRIVPTSKIGRLAELLNPESNWTPISNKFAVDTDLKRLYENVDLDILTSSGEYLIQNTMLLSVLHSAKALSANGKYLTKDLDETDNASEAMNMYDAYKSTKGLISTPEQVQGFDIKGTKVAGEDFEFRLSQFIRELNKSLQGDYDINSPSEARRTWMGKAALLLRRWYPATLVRRTRGIGAALKSSADLTTEEAYYNRATMTEEEGYYTTMVRLVTQLFKEAKRLKAEEGMGRGRAILEAIKVGKAKQLNYERANTMQGFADVAATFIYMGLATVLYSLGKKLDKKDKKSKTAIYMLAFWLLKSQRELTAYYNPNEMLKTVGSPTVLLKQIGEVLGLITAVVTEGGHQFSEPFSLNRYKRGRRKGESKLFKELSDVVPLLKQADKDVREQLSYMTNLKGF